MKQINDFYFIFRESRKVWKHCQHIYAAASSACWFLRLIRRVSSSHTFHVWAHEQHRRETLFLRGHAARFHAGLNRASALDSVQHISADDKGRMWRPGTCSFTLHIHPDQQPGIQPAAPTPDGGPERMSCALLCQSNHPLSPDLQDQSNHLKFSLQVELTVIQLWADDLTRYISLLGAALRPLVGLPRLCRLLKSS